MNSCKKTMCNNLILFTVYTYYNFFTFVSILHYSAQKWKIKYYPYKVSLFTAM